MMSWYMDCLIQLGTFFQHRCSLEYIPGIPILTPGPILTWLFILLSDLLLLVETYVSHALYHCNADRRNPAYGNKSSGIVLCDLHCFEYKKTLCEICTMQTSSCCVAPLKHVLAGQVSKWSILDSASILHSFICVQIYIVAFTTFWIRRIWFERIVLVVEVPDYVQISVVGILIKLIGTSSTLYYYYIFWGRLASIREFHPAY